MGNALKFVDIYTDGACSGNPGPGGWAAILVYNGREKEISGGERWTTNNRMELTAIIKALEALKEPCNAIIHTDSRYVADANNKRWLYYWMEHGWKTMGKKDVANAELWMRIMELSYVHTLTYKWVKGHADNPYNNRCDQMAVMESAKFKNADRHFDVVSCSTEHIEG